MAALCTITEYNDKSRSVKKIKWAWTSHTDGTVSGVGTTTGIFDGKLITLVTDPDGVAAPSDDYDIVINDADGLDVLVGAGADRDTANTELVAEASLGAVSASTLELVIANAGDTKKGVVWLFIR